MRKIFYFVFILLAVLFFWPEKKADAKVWMIDTQISNAITLENGIVVTLIEWDKKKYQVWCRVG